jgi:hypothetical protein
MGMEKPWLLIATNAVVLSPGLHDVRRPELMRFQEAAISVQDRQDSQDSCLPTFSRGALLSL